MVKSIHMEDVMGELHASGFPWQAICWLASFYYIMHLQKERVIC